MWRFSSWECNQDICSNSAVSVMSVLSSAKISVECLVHCCDGLAQRCSPKLFNMGGNMRVIYMSDTLQLGEKLPFYLFFYLFCAYTF